VESSVAQDVEFSNVQKFNITATTYSQDIKQETTISSLSSSLGRRANRASLIAQDWPLNANISLIFNPDSVPQTTTIKQGLHKTEADLSDADGAYWSQLDQLDNASDTLIFSPDFSTTLGNNGQSSSQSYSFLDSDGQCWSRTIASKNGALTSKKDGFCWF
jgi:hypothetical protein